MCLKRPEIPDERYGRCEQCARGGRVAYRFRVGAARGGTGLAVKAGELSPHALHAKLGGALLGYAGAPGVKPHLGLHEVELVTANKGARLESVRLAANLGPHAAEVVAALRQAAERNDASW
ncbi:MAG: hypothetical protein M3010_00075 [Candidatus Dormibacteraeota bacterium]|nr:hypothetical protein [Candidatus Dormibacteraeota bacterium]